MIENVSLVVEWLGILVALVIIGIFADMVWTKFRHAKIRKEDTITYNYKTKN